MYSGFGQTSRNRCRPCYIILLARASCAIQQQSQYLGGNAKASSEELKLTASSRASTAANSTCVVIKTHSHKFGVVGFVLRTRSEQRSSVLW